MPHPSIAIVGAGLAGLTAAYRLQQKDYPSTMEGAIEPGERAARMLNKRMKDKG